MICPNCEGAKCKVCHKTGEVSASAALKMIRETQQLVDIILKRDGMQKKLTEWL